MDRAADVQERQEPTPPRLPASPFDEADDPAQNSRPGGK
jgi:hypothetical protein